MKKYGIAALLAAFVLIASQSVSGSSMLKSAELAPDTKLQVFGRTVQTDIIAAEKVGVKGKSNYVSARDLAEQLGYQVKYDSKNKIISVGLYPQDGVELNTDDLNALKKNVKASIDDYLSNASTRQLASFDKVVAQLLQVVDGDPLALAVLLVDDYKGYTKGSETALDFFWPVIEENGKQ